MVNRDVTAAKLSDLAGRVARIRQHTKSSAAELAGDQDAFELVSFNRPRHRSSRRDGRIAAQP